MKQDKKETTKTVSTEKAKAVKATPAKSVKPASAKGKAATKEVANKTEVKPIIAKGESTTDVAKTEGFKSPVVEKLSEEIVDTPLEKEDSAKKMPSEKAPVEKNIAKRFYKWISEISLTKK